MENEEKKIDVYIFIIFPVAGTNEKNIYNEKKNIGAEKDLGYCPIVLQGRQLYRDRGCKAWIVLQETWLGTICIAIHSGVL